MANVKETAEAVKTAAAKKVEETKAAVKTAAKAVEAKAEEVVEEVAKVETEKVEAAKAETAPVEEPKPERKRPGRKPGSKNKTTKAKEAKKEAGEPEIYVQFGASESSVQAAVDKIKAEYVQQGHRASSIKSLKVYLKPEDNAAYYVINEKLAGRVDLF